MYYTGFREWGRQASVPTRAFCGVGSFYEVMIEPLVHFGFAVMKTPS